MSSKTERETTIYTCQCGAGTLVEETEQYAHTYYVGPVEYHHHFTCSACAAKWSIRPPRGGGKISLVPRVNEDARNAATTAMDRVRTVMADRRRAKAAMLAREEMARIEPEHVKSKAAELRYLADTHKWREPYSSYAKWRKTRTFEEMLRMCLLSDPRVADDPDMLAGLKYAEAERAAREAEYRAAIVPFTGTQVSHTDS